MSLGFNESNVRFFIWKHVTGHHIAFLCDLYGYLVIWCEDGWVIISNTGRHSCKYLSMPWYLPSSQWQVCLEYVRLNIHGNLNKYFRHEYPPSRASKGFNRWKLAGITHCYRSKPNITALYDIIISDENCIEQCPPKLFISSQNIFSTSKRNSPYGPNLSWNG